MSKKINVVCDNVSEPMKFDSKERAQCFIDAIEDNASRIWFIREKGDLFDQTLNYLVYTTICGIEVFVTGVNL